MYVKIQKTIILLWTTTNPANFSPGSVFHDQDSVPKNDVSEHPAKDAYAYLNSAAITDNTDHLYAVPDKPPRSESIIMTTGDTHSAGISASRSSMTCDPTVAAASGSQYDCLRRSEIEQHIL